MLSFNPEKKNIINAKLINQKYKGKTLIEIFKSIVKKYKKSKTENDKKNYSINDYFFWLVWFNFKNKKKYFMKIIIIIERIRITF